MNRIHIALAAVGLFAATQAAGQILVLDVNQTVPMAATMDNPCTAQAEAIVFSGTTQLAQRVWLQPDGSLRLQIAEQTALQGQDMAVLAGTSPAYAFSSGSIYDVEFMPVASATIWDFKQVTSGGTVADNFHSVLTIDFDPASLKLNLSLAPACDDGLPH